MKPLGKTLKQLAVVVMVSIISMPVKGQWGRTAPYVYLNTSTDNVGIGTTSPNYKLDIAGISGEVGLRVGDDGTKVFRMLWDNNIDEGVIDSWYSNGHHPIRISGSVIKLTGGNVGIGTMIPNANLEVNASVPVFRLNGNVTAGNRLSTIEFRNSGDLQMAKIAVDIGPIYNDRTNLLFHTSNGGAVSERVRIDYLGNVGIGTTSATEKLTVKGKILAEEVRVVVSVPDYVFAKEYKLKTLSEVSKFINEHKHLPEVPSEKEVLDNCGQVSLGEMNMTLLKKIEELTLYAIEQENNIKEQDEVIVELLKQNETILKRVTELEKQ